MGDFCEDGSEICQKLTNFLTENINWIQNQIESNKQDPYWHHVNNDLNPLIVLMKDYAFKMLYENKIGISCHGAIYRSLPWL